MSEKFAITFMVLFSIIVIATLDFISDEIVVEKIKGIDMIIEINGEEVYRPLTELDRRECKIYYK